MFDNGVAWENLAANIGVVFTTAQVWYTQIFEGTTINSVLERNGVGKE